MYLWYNILSRRISFCTFYVGFPPWVLFRNITPTVFPTVPSVEGCNVDESSVEGEKEEGTWKCIKTSMRGLTIVGQSRCNSQEFIALMGEYL